MKKPIKTYTHIAKSKDLCLFFYREYNANGLLNFKEDDISNIHPAEPSSAYIDLLQLTVELMLTGRLENIPPVVEPEHRADILDFYIQPPYTPFDETLCPVHPQALFRQVDYEQGEEIRPINGKAEKVGYQLIQLAI